MIHVFVRLCNVTNNKKRPEWFSYEKCFKSLFEEGGTVNVIFDGDPSTHFISNYESINVKRIEAGSQQLSFTKMLEHIKSLEIPDDDIVYLVEDDYLHRPGFSKILLEGFTTGADYVTLYDHSDKYFPGYYERYAKGFPIQLIPSESIHWRTTPSTCLTYAVKMKTFKRDFDIHYKWNTGEMVGKPFTDHQTFCELWNSGKSLISCIPSYCTHCDYAGITPVVKWELF